MKQILQSKALLICLFLILDIYSFQGILRISKGLSDKISIAIYILFGAFALSQILFLFLVSPQNDKGNFSYYALTLIIGFLLFQVSTSIFLLIDDIRRFVIWIYKKINQKSSPTNNTDIQISRSVFLSWVGVAIGTTFIGSLAYGFSNKYNYKIRRIKHRFPNLPESFRGLKIVQLSDIHSGSFTNQNAVARGIAMAMAEKPDLILFTGDLVNNKAEEMKDYTSIFSSLSAPMGVYSTLGNHDYGDYVSWPSEQAKNQNLEDLKHVHKQMGWRLLMNEHIIFDRNGEKIALLGIENWGAKGNFPKYGKMDLAYPGTEQIPFKILMSHDPSHWDAEVRTKYKDIDLTLAGHTHGMQFGVEIPGFKWSPIQWMYKQWAGLYKEDNQYLYVNRGYGFLGYPGRVGILPEITVIELM